MGFPIRTPKQVVPPGAASGPGLSAAPSHCSRLLMPNYVVSGLHHAVAEPAIPPQGQVPAHDGQITPTRRLDLSHHLPVELSFQPGAPGVYLRRTQPDIAKRPPTNVAERAGDATDLDLSTPRCIMASDSATQSPGVSVMCGRQQHHAAL